MNRIRMFKTMAIKDIWKSSACGWLCILLALLCANAHAALEPVAVQKLELKPGWNLVTLTRPLESMQSNVAKFLLLKPMRLDENANAYVACDKAEDVKAGIGYWVYASKAQTVELAQGGAQAVQSDLKTGWNLVGMTEGAAWADKATEIWAWRDGRFTMVQKSELQIGCAYWAYKH